MTQFGCQVLMLATAYDAVWILSCNVGHCLLRSLDHKLQWYTAYDAVWMPSCNVGHCWSLLTTQFGSQVVMVVTAYDEVRMSGCNGGHYIRRGGHNDSASSLQYISLPLISSHIPLP